MDWSEYFWKHTIWQIPHAFHENIDILLLFIFTTTIFCFIHRLRKFDFCWLFRILLVEMMSFVLYKTILSREYNEVINYCLIPFWSYRVEGEEGNNQIIEKLLNLLLFIPFGTFMAGSFRKVSIIKIVSLGCIFSLLIELSQLLFKRGFCETDDVIHNSIGCIIGCIIFKTINKYAN